MPEQREPISVCMAVYNGEAYIRLQVESILAQLGPNDELLAWDDCSRDRSVEILQSFGDPRVTIHQGIKNQGVNRTFEVLLGLARHTLIFMADQDDVWLPGRVDAMVRALHANNAWLVSSNTGFINREGAQVAHANIPLRAVDSECRWANITGIFRGRIGYYGCAMLMHQDLRKLILPFPPDVESHDLWIAMCANLARRNWHLEDATLDRRIHGGNASVVRRSLLPKLRSRVVFFRSLCVAIYRQAFGQPQ